MTTAVIIPDIESSYKHDIILAHVGFGFRPVIMFAFRDSVNANAVSSLVKKGKASFHTTPMLAFHC